jgi:predicted DNA-binding protein YlxM (UPF0122 family)
MRTGRPREESDRIEEMISLYENGNSLAVIAEKFEVSVTSIKGILNRRGIDTSNKYPEKTLGIPRSKIGKGIYIPKKTKQERDAELSWMLELRGKGFTFEAIGEKIGLTKQAVHLRITKYLNENEN